MAGRSNGGRRSDRDSDSMEVLKPLVVLSLFGMILYGAYSVVQKGPEPSTPAVAEAPPFASPDVQIAAPTPGTVPAIIAPPAAAEPTAPKPAPLAVPAQSPAANPTTTYLPAESAAPPTPPAGTSWSGWRRGTGPAPREAPVSERSARLRPVAR